MWLFPSEEETMKVRYFLVSLAAHAIVMYGMYVGTVDAVEHESGRQAISMAEYMQKNSIPVTIVQE